MITGKSKTVSIDNIQPNQWNYNEQSSFIYEKEKLSIHNHGFMEPILVRTIGQDKYEIIDGYHRWLACRELGGTEIPVIDLGKVPDEKAQTMTITMNELGGVPNEIKLSKILVSLAREGSIDDLAEELPFDDKELERLSKLTDFDWDQLKPREPLKDFHPDNESDVNLKTYTIVLTKQKFEIFHNIVKNVMQDTKSSEGRAMELICADVLSGL